VVITADIHTLNYSVKQWHVMTSVCY